MVPERHLLIAFTQGTQKCRSSVVFLLNLSARNCFVFLGNMGGRAQCRVTDEEIETWEVSNITVPYCGIPDCYLFFFDDPWQGRGCLTLVLCTVWQNWACWFLGSTPSILAIDLEANNCLCYRQTGKWLERWGNPAEASGAWGVSQTAGRDCPVLPFSE